VHGATANIHFSYIGKGVVLLMSEMVRINTRIGSNANDWLDNYSKETGIPKSTLVHLAVEHYMEHKEAFKKMADMGQLVEAIERLETKISKG